MKLIKYFLAWAFLVVSSVGFFSSAIIVEVPRAEGNQDIILNWPDQIRGDESTFFALIQRINEYLWFGIGAVCMVFIVIGWFKLMTANGKDEQLKAANKLLMGAIIGILIAVLSYSVIRLVVNLFDNNWSAPVPQQTTQQNNNPSWPRN